MLPRISRVVAGLVVAFAATGSPTSADQRVVSPVGPPTLDEATFLRRVRERSPRHALFDDRRRAAEANVAAAAVLPNPTLELERESVASIDNRNDFLRLGWTLDVAGRRGLAREAARDGARAEGATAARDAFVLQIDARLAYLDAAYARMLLAELDRARTSLVAIGDVLRSRARRGDASDYDAERAALEIETLDDERADALRSLQTGRLRLGALMGETAPYDAGDAITLPARPGEGTLVPIRSDVDAAVARAKRAEREAAIAGRGWVPRFDLVAGLMSSRSSGRDGVGYVIGIAGELPLLDRGGAAERRSRAEAKRWHSEARALSVEATSEAELARVELVARIDQAEAYAAGPAKRATDLLRRATVAYREGDRPILELLDVHRAARHAGVRGLQLVYQARRAELALRRVMGGTP